MSPNTLNISEVPRLGWLIDGNPDTAKIAVMLRNSGKAIELTIPLQGMFEPSDPYGRWFAFNTHFGDDPERTKYSYSPPRVLLFEDNLGTVVLMGCRASGANLGMNTGQGKIISNFAVLGGRHLDYEKVNGLRTESPGLTAWANLGHMLVNFVETSTDKARSISISLPENQEISLTSDISLKILSDWSMQRTHEHFEAKDHLVLETMLSEPTDWHKHLALHQKILDLASISAWQPFGYSRIEIQRMDDPERNLTGAKVADRWLQVETHRLPLHSSWPGQPRFLFSYGDVKADGIDRWLTLSDEYSRPIDSLRYMLRSPEQWSRSNIIESGIALEALGYLIDLKKHRRGIPRKDKLSFNSALKAILQDLEINPLEDEEGWIKRANQVFMGAKHADRPQQDALIELNTYRENLLILRFWIAQEIGADPKSLLGRLQTDPLGSEYTLLDS